MSTHFTIQDSKNVRNATKRIKNILDANYKRAYLKKIVNNLKYLSDDKKSLILKLFRGNYIKLSFKKEPSNTIPNFFLFLKYTKKL